MLLLVFFNTSGCSKTPLDYRYKYTGDWDFIVFYHWGGCCDVPYYDTTYTYQGKIQFGVHEIIDIEYCNHDKVSAKISKDGELSKNDSDEDHRGLEGKFTDKNHVEFHFNTGSNYYPTYYKVTGSR